MVRHPHCDMVLPSSNDLRGKCRLYRASTLVFLQADLLLELEWLNDISLQHMKNYQIWYEFPHERPISSRKSFKL